jgi:RND family efflux transporter MFP subunit
MKTRLITKLPILFALFFLSACTEAPETNSVQTQSQKKKVKKNPVKVMKMKKTEVDKTLEYSASLKAWEEVKLAPSIPGRIEKVYVEVSDYVRKGQLLALMDESSLKQAEIQLANLEADLKRYDTVQKVGALSKQMYETTLANLRATKLQVENLRENTRVVAPYDGIITAKYFEDGEIYSGAPNTQEGKASIVSMMKVNKLKALLNVSEAYYSQVEKGMQVTFVMDAYPGKEFTGSVERIYPTINEGSRTFIVEAMVQNDKNELRPGMYSKMELRLGHADVYLVPYLAVLKQQGSNERYVFTCENGKAKRHVVKIGKQYDEFLEIMHNGVDSNSKIIYSGHVNLNNGDQVQVVNK